MGTTYKHLSCEERTMIQLSLEQGFRQNGWQRISQSRQFRPTENRSHRGRRGKDCPGNLAVAPTVHNGQP